ncbi:MAG: flagellar biosynthetic protein FliO [Gallionellaceae bacterium CG1_02_56_997]|nr:flagellar biosynthetic protein FliO [Gallionella sp.]OIO82794.1 MAG: flagellar biosynthetic protein FliO [Gallionellaceae bacterium CG1_02_56_997]PIV15516.1 MAG: flagellar biosynthetic protein FliO [Gallionellales bacterium CG03_land_8_20_14_0_80_55_15]PIX04592.1 MAG: flagellar biosynthetic protein FliO [Gallionellales bacterium CG_4_8_14_3_um_filter_54_18]PJC05462.1 MAG: flagellar biosynthetic protein FliO [Gallionellales bacterium CG_4_9_14_0_8_um_filter_55_61]
MTPLPRNLIAFLMLLCSSAATALEGTRPAYTPPPVAVTSGSVAQILFSLLLVLAAIVAVAWLLKRMNLTQQGTGNLLKVVGSVPIGQRERVVLVEINDTWLVVGVGPGQIRTLHTLEKNTNLMAAPSTQSVPDNKFAQMLAPLLGKRVPTQEKNHAS